MDVITYKKITDIDGQLNGKNSTDLILPLSEYADGTSGGITYTKNASTNVVTVSGTRSGASFKKIFFSKNSMPNGFVAGETYDFVFSATSEKLTVNIIFYVNGNEDGNFRLYNASTDKTVTIPATVTGLECRFEAISGWTANSSATITFPKAYLVPHTDGLVKDINDIKTGLTSVKNHANDISTLINIFGNKPIYHHLFVENYNSYIPSESIYDIRIAKSLGFDMIEANTHKCSDNVYVVRHGDGDKLGDGLKSTDGNDYSETKFSEVTSEWIREKIRYDAPADKFCGYLPTLDEFCIECRKLSMKVKVSTTAAAMVARKYMPDEMIWSSGGERTRGFRGTIERVFNSGNETVAQCIDACKVIGAPLNIVIPGIPSAQTDQTISNLVTAAHENGFTVGIVYPTSKEIIRAFRLGVDCIGSVNYNINVFENGTAKHITELNDSSLVLQNGATYNSTDDIIEMTTGATVSCQANVRSGACSLVMRYSGKLSINIGVSSNSTNLNEYESDGDEYVFLANYLPVTGTNWANWFTITAGAETEIYELYCDCNIV